MQVNQFPGPRRDLLETGQVVTLFITFFQVNFLSPIDDESPRFLSGEKEKERYIFTSTDAILVL